MRARLFQRLLVTFVATAAAAPSWAATARTPPPSPPAVVPADPARDARLLSAFAERVKEYVELHKKANGTLPKLKDESSPTAIAAHQEVLGQRITQARATARPGDVFGADLEPVLRDLIRRELKRTPPARQDVLDENPRSEAPTKPVPLKVNAVYTEGAALSTVPVNVLLLLPKLPDDVLEYRFVGKALVLRDAVANIIVDYITEVVP